MALSMNAMATRGHWFVSAGRGAGESIRGGGKRDVQGVDGNRLFDILDPLTLLIYVLANVLVAMVWVGMCL